MSLQNFFGLKKQGEGVDPPFDDHEGKVTRPRYDETQEEAPQQGTFDFRLGVGFGWTFIINIALEEAEQ